MKKPISFGYEDMLYLKRGAYQWSILYDGWLWYCEDNIHDTIEFEETLSDIVMDGFVHCLYLMTKLFRLCGQGSHQRHCMDMGS